MRTVDCSSTFDEHVAIDRRPEPGDSGIWPDWFRARLRRNRKDDDDDDPPPCPAVISPAPRLPPFGAEAELEAA